MTDVRLRLRGRAQSLRLQPGDFVAVTLDDFIDEETAARIREAVAGFVPGHPVLVLCGGAKLTRVTPAGIFVSPVWEERIAALEERIAALEGSGEVPAG